MTALLLDLIHIGLLMMGIFSLLWLAYVKAAPLRHKAINRTETRRAIQVADTDRFIREQEHELWPDRTDLAHKNCSICGPGPLLQGVVPSKHQHPFFNKVTETVTDGYGSWKVERLKAALPAHATIVSSAVIDDERPTGKHTLMLDLDHPATLLESSTPGHYHLYVDHLMSWQQYCGVLKAMTRAGLVEQGYYRAARRQGATHLRPPWVRKPDGPRPPPNAPRRRNRSRRWDSLYQGWREK